MASESVSVCHIEEAKVLAEHESTEGQQPLIFAKTLQVSNKQSRVITLVESLFHIVFGSVVKHKDKEVLRISRNLDKGDRDKDQLRTTETAMNFLQKQGMSTIKTNADRSPFTRSSSLSTRRDDNSIASYNVAFNLVMIREVEKAFADLLLGPHSDDPIEEEINLSMLNCPKEDRSLCIHCGRFFASERFKTHVEVCEKLSNKKRKAFKSSEQRLQGTDSENFQNTGNINLIKSDWRLEHEQLLKTLRSSRESLAQAKKNGGQGTDPPPLKSNPNYIECPYCERRFCPRSVDRHIKLCSTRRFRSQKSQKSRNAQGSTTSIASLGTSASGSSEESKESINK